MVVLSDVITYTLPSHTICYYIEMVVLSDIITYTAQSHYMLSSH